VEEHGRLTYAATVDEPLAISGGLNITGGSLGWVIAPSLMNAKIAVTGAANVTSALKLNISAMAGQSLPSSTSTYTLIQGGANSNLNGAPYTLTVFNNTNYTVGTPAVSATEITVPVTGGATPLSTAFWTGSLSTATTIWGASNGSTQSNWVGTPGGAPQGLVPGATTDIVFSNTAVTTSPAASTLGADMTIRSLTQQDSTRAVGLNADGFTLTVTPLNPSTGITLVAGAQAVTINPNVILGAAQTWTNNAASRLLTVAGRDCLP
jgi:hypothetical protein